ncbi:hypothetical protein ABK040_007819 [Willaertia magna]
MVEEETNNNNNGRQGYNESNNNNNQEIPGMMNYYSYYYPPYNPTFTSNNMMTNNNYSQYQNYINTAYTHHYSTMMNNNNSINNPYAYYYSPEYIQQQQQYYNNYFNHFQQIKQEEQYNNQNNILNNQSIITDESEIIQEALKSMIINKNTTETNEIESTVNNIDNTENNDFATLTQIEEDILKQTNINQSEIHHPEITPPTFTEKIKQQKKTNEKKINLKKNTHIFNNERDLTDFNLLITEFPETLKFNQNYIDDHLTKSILKLFQNELIPTKKEIEKKVECFDKLKILIKRKWNNAELFMFGSSLNGLSLRGSSDVDFCFVIEMDIKKKSNVSVVPTTIITTEENNNSDNNLSEQEDVNNNQQVEKKKKKKKPQLTEEQAHKKNYVSQLKQYLEYRLQYKDVKALFNARIPIVKFIDPVTGLNCDIGVNNVLAVYNTKLLQTYSEIDERCKELIFMIKFWSKRREINDPYLGTLSSYCIAIITIHYLQKVLLVPYLQDIQSFPKMEKKEIDGMDGKFYNCSFESNMTTIHSFMKENYNEDHLITTITTGSLLFQFFKYFAYEFDYENQVINIKNNSKLTKKEKGWTNPLEQRNYFCVEDPFELDFNVARSVSEEGLKEIRYECIRAYHLICKQANFKDVVCAKLSKTYAQTLK